MKKRKIYMILFFLLFIVGILEMKKRETENLSFPKEGETQADFLQHRYRLQKWEKEETIRQEMREEWYQIKRKKQKKGKMVVCYPVFAIEDTEREILLNEILYQEGYFYEEEAYSWLQVDYQILYADSQYVSILYSSHYDTDKEEIKNRHRGIVIEVETGQKITLNDLWVNSYRIKEAFETAPFYYAKEEQMEWVLQHWSSMTGEERVKEWWEGLSHYYIRENRIGVIIEEEFCLEIEFSWKEFSENKDILFFYENPSSNDSGETQIEREWYRVEQKKIDVPEEYQKYVSSDDVLYYPQILMEDEEKADRITQIFYEGVMYNLKKKKEGKVENKSSSHFYRITYADDRYLSVLYIDYNSGSNCYWGVTVDLNTEEQVSLDTFGDSDQWYTTFLEAERWYVWDTFEPIMVSRLKRETREEFLNSWNESDEHIYDYYLTGENVLPHTERGLAIILERKDFEKKDLVIEIKY